MTYKVKPNPLTGSKDELELLSSQWHIGLAFIIHARSYATAVSVCQESHQEIVLHHHNLGESKADSLSDYTLILVATFQGELPLQDAHGGSLF